MKKYGFFKRAAAALLAAALLLSLAACGKKKDYSPKVTTLSAGGVELDRFFSYSGEYVEDGSDAPLEDIAAITVTNKSETAYQLIKFDLMAGGEHYYFTVTSFLPGMTLTALESEKKLFPAGKTETYLGVAQSGEYAVKPEKHEDLYKAEVYNGIVNLTNLADRDFDKDIYVYYKNRDANGYLGGITYRVNMGPVKKGGVSQRPSQHLKQGNSEILYITNGE